MPRFSQLLLLLWKLSTIFALPVILLLYRSLLNSYAGSFTFEQLDQGINIHKWWVFGLYLVYLLLWNRCNKWVISYLKKLEY